MREAGSEPYEQETGEQKRETRRQEVGSWIIVMLKQWPTLYVKERRLCYKGERAVSHERRVHARISRVHTGAKVPPSKRAEARSTTDFMYYFMYLQENNCYSD